MELELLSLDEPPKPVRVADKFVAAPAVQQQPAATKALVVAEVKAGVLSELTAIERGIAELRAQHGATDYDITTPAGLKLATERRYALRQVRYKVPHILKARKAELKDVLEALDEAGKGIVDAILKIETPHDTAITAEEDRRKKAKEAEAARVAAHQGNLDQIRGLYTRASGKSAADIQTGIDWLKLQVVDPAKWEEFAEKAMAAIDETVQALETLLAETKRQDAERAEREWHAQVQGMITILSDRVAGCIGESAAYIRTQIAETEPAAAYIEPVRPAAEKAIERMKKLLAAAEADEAREREIADRLAAEQAGKEEPASEGHAAAVATDGAAGVMPGAEEHAREDAACAAPPRMLVDAAIAELEELAEIDPADPLPGPIVYASPALPADAEAAMRAALALIDVVAGLFTGVPDTPEWRAELRGLVEKVEPMLLRALGEDAS